MSEAELVLAQLAGLASWQRANGVPTGAVACGTAKDIRLDAALRHAARQRQREAIQARAATFLAGGLDAPVPRGRLRVIVVHPHDYRRHNLVRAFNADRRCAVIAEATDGAAGVGLAVIEQPDLVLLAQQMAYMTGFEAAREIRRHAPHTTVAMQVVGTEYLEPALAAGARAAVTATTPLSRVVDVTSAAVRGVAEQRESQRYERSRDRSRTAV